MSKKSTTTKNRKGLLILLIIIAVIAAVYAGLTVFFTSHFFWNSTVNGVDASGKTSSQVYSEIQDEAKKYQLNITLDGKTEKTITADDIDLTVNYAESVIDDVLSTQNAFLWPTGIFSNAAYESVKGVTYNADTLVNILENTTFSNQAKATESEDATLSFNKKTGLFEIQDEVYGDKIDSDKLFIVTANAVQNLMDEIKLEDGDTYEKPSVLSDDADLSAALDTVNGYMNTTITYDLGETTETADAATKATWFTLDGTTLSFDEEAIGTFVDEMGDKYNTYGKRKNLVASTGETVSVPAGTYGWKIDKDGEIAQIEADLKAGEPVTRDFVYLYTANSHGENDYGDDYIEVNLTAQHVWIYKDGVSVFDTDCVTGNVYANHDTHTGCYAIAYKAKNATLRGDNYESFVNYWMPFHNGEGLHDATWRSSFGGTIYQGNGSHGCVNLPLSAAKTIYETVDAGWPVLVFYTGNTEAEIEEVRAPYISVMNLIAEIETVTAASADIIGQARAAYNALADDQKANVTNYDQLVQAEQQLLWIQLGISQ